MGKLPFCLLILSRKTARMCGHFSPDRWEDHVKWFTFGSMSLAHLDNFYSYAQSSGNGHTLQIGMIGGRFAIKHNGRVELCASATCACEKYRKIFESHVGYKSSTTHEANEIPEEG